jgi:hypothetical protein
MSCIVTTRNSFCVGLIIAAAAFSGEARATNWNVARVNHMTLTPPGGVIVKEMSGVTYVGPAGGSHRFLAAMENAIEASPGTKHLLVQFDLSFNASGGITSISNVADVLINPGADFEGIAYTNPARNSVFLADEGMAAVAPRVREVNLASTSVVQTLTLPTLFANKVNNRGFESLTRSPDATVMWTANEEALTVDGNLSTQAAGSVVRLLKMSVAGDTVTAGQQFAYVTQPIHGGPALGQERSGVSDLTLMPDGTLLALERSFAATGFLNRVVEIDFAGATDVSVAPFDTGLIGDSYTPVIKHELWQGQSDGASGQNLEGLALGPRLANGSWVLIGVTDDEDGLLADHIVAFTATANTTADFNTSGDADGADFLAWQRGYGKTIGAGLTDGDGDRDGDVDAADYNLWKAAFAQPVSTTVPEPTVLPLAFFASLAAAQFRRRHSA